MNKIKRTLALMLCLVLVLSNLPMTTIAAGSANITLSVDKTEVEVGDTITVKLGITEMTGTSIAFGFDFDRSLLEATSVPSLSKCKLEFATYDPDEDEEIEEELTATTRSSKTEVNNSGHFGVAFAYSYPEEALYSENDAVITLKFEALAAGTVKFEMFEKSGGTDGYAGNWTAATTVTIKGACDHTNTSTTKVSNGNGTHKVVCECGETVNESVTCSGGTATCTTKAKCADCKAEYGSVLGHKDGNNDHACDNGCNVYQGTHADGTDNDHKCDYCNGTVDGENHTAGRTEDVTTPASCTEEGKVETVTFCAECGEEIGRVLKETVPSGHTWGTTAYSWSADGSTCTATRVCQKDQAHTETLKAKVTPIVTTPATCQVKGWTTYTATFQGSDWATTKTKELQDVALDINNHDGKQSTTYVDNENGKHTVTVTCECGGEVSTETVDHSYVDGKCVCEALEHVHTPATYTINGDKHTAACACGEYTFEAEVHTYDAETHRCVCNAVEPSGWLLIDGAWFYVNPDTYVKATGIARVPYPTVAINGITYGPNAEDKAYTENKGQVYINATSAAFYFDSTGKFQQVTGCVGNSYAVNGMLDLHVGLVKTAEGYMYFLDKDGNGYNEYLTGDVYVTRNVSDRDVKLGGVYTFGSNGYLVENNGIVTMANSTKRYYVDALWMQGLGLVKVGDNYIYVPASGNLIVNAEYWVPANSYNIVPGTYEFDANGFLLNPASTDKEGIFFENGAWYYYESGKIVGNKGLIRYDGNWINDGKVVMEESCWIYVRSNGQLATGYYYVTNIGDEAPVVSGQKCLFSDYGVLQTSKNGIFAENGSLYYYQNNNLVYGAGVIELNGNYYYVKSNGEVVHNATYWITNVGNTNVISKAYAFDANGVMLNPEFKSDVVLDGVVDGYYYVNGKCAYGAGVLKLTDEAGKTYYIYVRSNGALATGVYWPTNTNGLLKAMGYDWGTDGKLYLD